MKTELQQITLKKHQKNEQFKNNHEIKKKK